MPIFCEPCPGKIAATTRRLIRPFMHGSCGRSCCGSRRRRPGDDGGCPGKAGSERHQEQVVARLDATVVERVLQRDGNAGRGVVAVLVDGDDDAFTLEVETLARGLVESGQCRRVLAIGSEALT